MKPMLHALFRWCTSFSTSLWRRFKITVIDLWGLKFQFGDLSKVNPSNSPPDDEDIGPSEEPTESPSVKRFKRLADVSALAKLGSMFGFPNVGGVLGAPVDGRMIEEANSDRVLRKGDPYRDHRGLMNYDAGPLKPGYFKSKVAAGPYLRFDDSSNLVEYVHYYPLLADRLGTEVSEKVLFDGHWSNNSGNGVAYLMLLAFEITFRVHLDPYGRPSTLRPLPADEIEISNRVLAAPKMLTTPFCDSCTSAWFLKGVVPGCGICLHATDTAIIQAYATYFMDLHYLKDLREKDPRYKFLMYSPLTPRSWLSVAGDQGLLQRASFTPEEAYDAAKMIRESGHGVTMRI